MARIHLTKIVRTQTKKKGGGCTILQSKSNTHTQTNTVWMFEPTLNVYAKYSNSPPEIEVMFVIIFIRTNNSSGCVNFTMRVYLVAIFKKFQKILLWICVDRIFLLVDTWHLWTSPTVPMNAQREPHTEPDSISWTPEWLSDGWSEQAMARGPCRFSILGKRTISMILDVSGTIQLTMVQSGL